jgi:hypothetical protein
MGNGKAHGRKITDRGYELNRREASWTAKAAVCATRFRHSGSLAEDCGVFNGCPGGWRRHRRLCPLSDHGAHTLGNDVCVTRVFGPFVVTEHATVGPFGEGVEARLHGGIDAEFRHPPRRFGVVTRALLPVSGVSVFSSDRQMAGLGTGNHPRRSRSEPLLN